MPAAKPGARRLQILQVLARMLENPKGEKVTTAALAKELDVSEAALYRHFASKAQMFEGLIEFIEQTLFGLVNKITAEEENGLKQAQAILSSLLSFAEKNPGMTRVLVGDALVNEDERLQVRINQLHDRLEATLKQCLRVAATQGHDAPAGTWVPAGASCPCVAATRRHCLSVASRRSCSWLMRTWSRSSSFTSASPTSTRVMPGFFSAKLSSEERIAWACFRPFSSSAVILFTRPNSVCSMNSIRPSNICALLAKCRYSAASDTSSSLARAAVVTFSPFGFSSIRASTCRICRRRAPGLAAGMASSQTVGGMLIV